MSRINFNRIEKGDIDMYADLHCHSKISDGSTAVDELVSLAKSKGISTISVTDHDTFSGSEKASVFGERLGVSIIKGTEISCFDYNRKRKVHLLCYMPNRPEPLSAMFNETNRKRKKAMEASIEKVLKVYPIPCDMILKRAEGSVCIYKQHVMQALIDAGYANEIFGNVFRKLFDSRFGIAKTSVEYPDAFDALKLVRESGGVAVLAHPAVYDSYDIMLEMIEKGLDGIEVSYPRAKETDAKLLGELCEKHNLIKTGGTDFHGMNSTRINPLGTCMTLEEEVQKIIELSKSRA